MTPSSLGGIPTFRHFAIDVMAGWDGMGWDGKLPSLKLPLLLDLDLDLVDIVGGRFSPWTSNK